MVLKIPQLHCFPNSLTSKVSEETDYSLSYWEISVQRRDDLAWSIVLSYLLSTNYKNKDDFSRRLRLLSGSDKNLSSVKKSISFFNPFRNRYSCFYDGTLKELIKQFKSNLNWNNLYSISDKLEAACTLLHCDMKVIWKDKTCLRSRIYHENAEEDKNCITLYKSELTDDETGSTGTLYNFLIKYHVGLKMKLAALVYFLKESKIPYKKIQKIIRIAENSKHFLISILNSDCKDVIHILYKSTYIISKLAEAGYEIDPRTSLSGFSALSHALMQGDVKILYELYYFAANNCFESRDHSYRNPDCCIVNNLLEIEKILLEDLTKSEDLNPLMHKDLKKTFGDLLRLNKFLTEVNSKILKIKTKLNYYESTNETAFEASKRRDIVVSVLDTYEEFFMRIQNDNTTVSPLDDYVMFKNYYNLVDMATAIIFFDNILFLKERLLLEKENQFSEIESSFFLSVLYHVAFDKVNFTDICKNSDPFVQTNIVSFYIFPLVRRLDNMVKIKEFSKDLRETVINEDNVVKCIPKREIYSIFNSYPILKDGFHLKRLQSYIKIALNVKVTDIKSVLVIERVLQVIGEYITPEETNYCSVRRFFSLILSKEIIRILLRTRNELSHLKSYTFKSKQECEMNFSLFRSIQKEIRAIQYQLNPVFQIHQLNSALYLIKMFEEQLEEIRKSSQLYVSSNYCPFYLHDEINHILKQIFLLSLQKYSSVYQEMLNMTLCCVEKDMNETDWTKDWDSVKNHVSHVMGPLKYLIELGGNWDESRFKTLLNVFEILEQGSFNTDPINELKDTAYELLAKCKSLIHTFKTQKKRRKIKQLKCIRNIEHFLKILRGFTYLSNEAMDEIRREIPETIKQDVSIKQRLIKSIQEGFSLNIEGRATEFEISYFSNKKKNTFYELYKTKNSQALVLLETLDPIAELEDVFLKNSVDKKRYDDLCNKMQFSDKTKKTLGRLVAGQRQKVPGNNLKNLLNRIHLMKKVIIEENEEIFNLWKRAKRQSSRQYITDKIVQNYLRYRPFQAAVEMLLFDCMSIFESEKDIKNPWVKSSKLYCGINLRNVISHGSPLLEALCKLLDPEDLPSDMIQKMVQLIESEDAIEAILELFERNDNDYVKFQSIINSKDKDEYFDLKSRIWRCDEWKTFTLFLPYRQKRPDKNA